MTTTTTVPITATMPDCAMCGLTWAAACAEAVKAGREWTGWATLHGPHGRHEVRCAACNVQAKQDGEIARLRHIIGEAREELRIPHDPDCQACSGTGRFHDDVTRWSHRCDCHEPYPIAVARHEREQRAEAEQRARFERDHGHGYDEGCKTGCPVEF